jgi:TolA-binding protein
MIPALAPAQNKAMLEMNRDIALLQEEVRNMKKADADRFDAIDTALRQLLDQVNATNHQVTGMDGRINDRMSKNVVNPVNAVGLKVDSLSEDFRSVKENVNEMRDQVGKLQQQIVDLNNVIRTMQAPPTPPPAATTAPATNAAPTGPPAGITSEGLYRDALHDKTAFNYDQALKEFGDYMTYFGQTEYAPNAQYYIGEIKYNQKKYDEASEAFDAVLALPKNSKTADAHFMKGRSLVRLGQKSDAAKEYRAAIAADPHSDAAHRAQAELRDLGLSSTTTRKKRSDNQ